MLKTYLYCKVKLFILATFIYMLQLVTYDHHLNNIFVNVFDVILVSTLMTYSHIWGDISSKQAINSSINQSSKQEDRFLR